MPDAQHEDGSGRDLVAHLVVAHDDPADFARLIGFQLLADPRIIEQPIGRMGELLDHARCRLGCDRAQMLVQSHKVRRCLARPLDLHLTGEGSGLSVPRLSAHAWGSEEHTSELQSLMRNSYAVFCLKKK